MVRTYVPLAERSKTETSCIADACGRPKVAKGLCIKHYRRAAKGQVLAARDEITFANELAKVTPCLEHACERMVSVVNAGTCNVHYTRVRMYGSYLNPRRRMRPEIVAVSEKRCRGCGQTLPSWRFSKSGKSKDGLMGRCTKCATSVNRERGYSAKGRYAKYGLTVEQYDAMVSAQSGRCLICNGEPARKLVVDHCHAGGQVRGLLCHGCNVGIGHLRDDPIRLIAAAAYLSRAAA